MQTVEYLTTIRQFVTVQKQVVHLLERRFDEPGYSMNKFFASFLSASFFLTSSAAFAVSCTQQGETCKGWASGQGSQATSYAAKCAREVSACISRCKKGSKVFIGVYGGSGGGQQYPIDECR